MRLHAPGAHGVEACAGVVDCGFVRGVCLGWGVGGAGGGGVEDSGVEWVQLRVGEHAAEAHDRVGFRVQACHLQSVEVC